MPEAPYAPFRSLDGSHPLRAAFPEGCLTYPARRVRDARVAWLNFALAREMGLLPRDHPDRLTPGLRDAGLDAFAIRIVNEWDVANRIPIPLDAWKPGRYMATRYLQLQHPGRQGRTSGDGRSVWIGCVEGPDGAWDVSACGTGVTALCPATAATRRFHRTGGRSVSYGCGTASLQEGFAADEPYDLVTLFDVLEHVPDEAGFLAWIEGLLPGGAARVGPSPILCKKIV